MKFVDVKNDIAFRKIFGNENKKVILISFLNAVLHLEGENRIENLEVIPENTNDEGLEEAYDDANKNTWTKQELEAYDYMAMREQDGRGRITLAETRALQKGEEKGKQEKEKELVTELWKNGVPMDIIAKSAKLKVEQVQQMIIQQEKEN